MTSKHFLIHFILNNVNIKYIAVGNDFCFGKNRIGNITYLKKMSEIYKFVIFFQPNLGLHGMRISSSLIKKKILSGKFIEFKNLLGHDFYISGKVRHGTKRKGLLVF
ncbi:hypothetical protein [Buchnera aphidicola]|uniref:hypothetical protein n=1 Tax=Buchnera aphidicola TaxID=9 RepID=UPI003464C54D